MPSISLQSKKTPASPNPSSTHSNVEVYNKSEGKNRLKNWLIKPIALAVGTIAAMEAFTRYPAHIVAKPMQLPADTQHLVLLLHGTGCSDEPFTHAIKDRYQSIIGEEPGVSVKLYNWSPHSDFPLRAEARALPIAEQLGQELSTYKDLKRLHLISHSAGAFIPTPLCETLRKESDHPIDIEMTYIDSMQMHGGWWDQSYGARHYGSCANFSSAIFTHNTVINGCNRPLQQSYSIDVTDMISTADTEKHHRWPLSHYFPLEYYLNGLNEEKIKAGMPSHKDFPRGAIEHPQPLGA